MSHTHTYIYIYTDADDSVLLVSGKDVAEIEAALSVELEAVQEWLVDNKLSRHLGKQNQYCLHLNVGFKEKMV